MKWTFDDTPRRRVEKRRNPIIDVMCEPIVAEDGKGGQNSKEALMIRHINKAFGGDKKMLVVALKRGARRERKLISEGRYDEHVTYETQNLNFERVGDVTELLGIARPVDAPPTDQRDWFERDQRYNLEDWVIPLIRKEQRCSDEHLAAIRVWQAEGCPQWRPKTYLDQMMGEMSDEIWDLCRQPGRPKGSKNKPKLRIHPYDRKVNFLHNGQHKSMRVMEALMFHARKYAATHPNDTEISGLLLDINERAEAAYEKRCEGLDDSGPFRTDGDEKLYVPLSVWCLERALMGFGGASILYAYRPYARAVLEPWLVQAALDRRKTRFTRSQQQRIVNRTRQPDKVNWPDRFDRDVIEYRGPGRPAAAKSGSEADRAQQALHPEELAMCESETVTD